MPRKRQTAAEYIDDVDEVMRIILGELLENASKANLHWAAAHRNVRENPERALDELVGALVALDVPVRIERADALRYLNRASDLLDTELPGESEPATEKG